MAVSRPALAATPQPGRVPDPAPRSGGACQTSALVGSEAKQHPDRSSPALEKCHRGQAAAAFVEHRLARLYDELRPGLPRSIEDEQKPPCSGPANQPEARAGVSGKRPNPAEFPNRLCTPCCRPSHCSPTAAAVLSSPPILSSSRRYPTLLACT